MRTHPLRLARPRRLVTAAVLGAAVVGALTACGTSTVSSPTLRNPASATAAAAPASSSPVPAPTSTPTGTGSMGETGMSHMDHGQLSVTIMISDSSYAVAGPVSPGQYVSVVNHDPETHTITATVLGAFDVAVPHGQLVTFPAPTRAGDYAFSSRDQPTMHAVLTVR